MDTIRVLLIEDDVAYADLVRHALSESETQAFALSDVQYLGHAVERLKHESFDVVLTDLRLPDAHGLEAVARIQKTAPDMPVIVLSGNADMKLALESIRHGAQDYLIKGGIECISLVRTIRYAIERKRVRDFEKLLVAVASHDLRGPLHSIMLGTQLLLESTPAGDPSEQTIHDVQFAAERAGQLIRDLLDATQIRLGHGLAMRFEAVDLGSVVPDVVRAVEKVYRGRRVELHLEGDLRLHGDPSRIAQLLENVIGNALKHSPTDAAVEMWLAGEEDAVALEVHNGGPPIPERVKEHLFEPFVRAAQGTADPSGVGLGMYIVRHIVRGHGGTVELRSDETHGTSVHVRLPRMAGASLGDTPADEDSRIGGKHHLGSVDGGGRLGAE